ncbi:caffeic acid 3-O-methyltransferase-like protein [Tanacetum coccineum]
MIEEAHDGRRSADLPLYSRSARATFSCSQAYLAICLRFKVEEAVLEGGTPFDKVHETSGFEYMGLDARFNKIFNKAIVDTSIIVIKEVLNCYHGFENLKSLVKFPGIEHVGGDMFKSSASDSNCIKLLKNCYKSLPEHGKVIVVDKILPVLPDTNCYVKCGTNQDTIMMTQTPGGK